MNVKKSILKKESGKLTTFVKIIGIAITILIPIIYTEFSRQKFMSIYLIDKISLIEFKEDPVLKDIKITFQNKTINNIVKYKFSIVNSGFTSISNKDVINFPAINFPSDAVIYIAKVSNKEPKNQKVEIEVKNNIILIKFELLNQNDYIDIIIYTSSTVNPDEYLARIDGMKTLSFEDKTNDIKIEDRVNWFTYISWFAAILLIIAIPLSYKQSILHTKFKKYIIENPDYLENQLTDKVKFSNLLIFTLTKFLTNKEEKELVAFVDSTNDFQSIKNELIIKISKYVYNDESSKNGLFGITLLWILSVLHLLYSYNLIL